MGCTAKHYLKDYVGDKAIISIKGVIVYQLRNQPSFRSFLKKETILRVYAHPPYCFTRDFLLIRNSLHCNV